MTHDPLTQRVVHELREIDPDPKDWWEGPDGSLPLHLFIGRPAFSAWGAIALGIGMVAFLAALVFGVLLLFRWMAR
jgi:hypothetical protein